MRALGSDMAAMDFKIPTVLTSEELMEKAFHRASKIRKEGTNSLDTKKKTALAKVTASGDIIVTALQGYVNKFPRLEKEGDFLPELVDIVIGIDRYKKALGAVNWCATKADKLKNDTLRDIRRTKDPEIVEATRRSFYGRLNSYVDRISDDLLFLQDAKNKFRRLPAVEPDTPTIVVAGFPNVGKSNLVTVLSSAEPEIAPYPFTTKGVIVGHIKDDWRKYQIIDTPGLLDREFDKRNAIEKQAVLALRYLTDVMLFVIDPSESCGFPREMQERLLATIKDSFTGVTIIEAESKADIMKTGGDRICFSAQSGENMDILTGRILEELRYIARRKAAEAQIE
ncbi:NOG1 family protein [Candidatus Methanoprimaticola sp. MG2]|uniref:NOG1 family protein n=1 Tax=Candidatus Methanoprimaticola sp. MG2 TaxID=3228838 RepID=UPI0039C6549D